MVWSSRSSQASLKTPYQVRRIDSLAGALYGILHRLETLLGPGIRGVDLEAAAIEEARARGLSLALQGHGGFPAAICVSVNSCVAHGVPDRRPLEAGDVVTVDLVVAREGWHADASWTWQVGPGDSATEARLRRAWAVSLAAATAAGGGLRAMGAAAQYQAADKLWIMPEFAGHGLGREIHEQPRISLVHSRQSIAEAPALEVGMVFTVEPVLVWDPRRETMEGHPVCVCEVDGSWRVGEGLRGAQFELMVALDREGPRILGLDLQALAALSLRPRLAEVLGTGA